MVLSGLPACINQRYRRSPQPRLRFVAVSVCSLGYHAELGSFGDFHVEWGSLDFRRRQRIHTTTSHAGSLCKKVNGEDELVGDMVRSLLCLSLYYPSTSPCTTSSASCGFGCLDRRMRLVLSLLPDGARSDQFGDGDDKWTNAPRSALRLAFWPESPCCYDPYLHLQPSTTAGPDGMVA